MSLSPTAKLAEHLSNISRDPLPGGRILEGMAAAILRDPQAHIDALVEVDLLHVYGTELEPKDRSYRPKNPRPHKHKWSVVYAKCTADRLALVCATGNDESCSELRYIDNLSPFTIPED